MTDARATLISLIRLTQAATENWARAASKAGIDLKGLNSETRFDERVAWAHERGLAIGCVLARSESLATNHELVVDCIRFAAAHSVFIPQEHILWDRKDANGRMTDIGLRRTKAILLDGSVGVIIVHDLKKLFSKPHLGSRFFSQAVVTRGIRGLDVASNVDTHRTHQLRIFWRD